MPAFMDHTRQSEPAHPTYGSVPPMGDAPVTQVHVSPFGLEFGERELLLFFHQHELHPLHFSTWQANQLDINGSAIVDFATEREAFKAACLSGSCISGWPVTIDLWETAPKYLPRPIAPNTFLPTHSSCPAVPDHPADSSGPSFGKGGPKPNRSEDHNLYVLNLPPRATEEELRALFARQGKVTHCVILAMLDAQDRRRAFIDMETPAQARRAIHQINGVRWYGFILDVSYAHNQRSTDQVSQRNSDRVPPRSHARAQRVFSEPTNLTVPDTFTPSGYLARSTSDGRLMEQPLMPPVYSSSSPPAWSTYYPSWEVPGEDTQVSSWPYQPATDMATEDVSTPWPYPPVVGRTAAEDASIPWPYRYSSLTGTDNDVLDSSTDDEERADQPEKDRTIFLFGLPFELSKEALRALGERCGTVVKADFHLDLSESQKESEAHIKVGSLTFGSVKAAEKAVVLLDGRTIGGAAAKGAKMRVLSGPEWSCHSLECGCTQSYSHWKPPAEKSAQSPPGSYTPLYQGGGAGVKYGARDLLPPMRRPRRQSTPVCPSPEPPESPSGTGTSAFFAPPFPDQPKDELFRSTLCSPLKDFLLDPSLKSPKDLADAEKLPDHERLNVLGNNAQRRQTQDWPPPVWDHFTFTSVPDQAKKDVPRVSASMDPLHSHDLALLSSTFQDKPLSNHTSPSGNTSSWLAFSGAQPWKEARPTVPSQETMKAPSVVPASSSRLITTRPASTAVQRHQDGSAFSRLHPLTIPTTSGVLRENDQPVGSSGKQPLKVLPNPIGTERFSRQKKPFSMEHKFFVSKPQALSPLSDVTPGSGLELGLNTTPLFSVAGLSSASSRTTLVDISDEERYEQESETDHELGLKQKTM